MSGFNGKIIAHHARDISSNPGKGGEIFGWSYSFVIDYHHLDGSLPHSCSPHIGFINA